MPVSRAPTQIVTDNPQNPTPTAVATMVQDVAMQANTIIAALMAQIKDLEARIKALEA